MIKGVLKIGTAVILMLTVASITYFSFMYLFPPVEKPVSTVLQQLINLDGEDDVLVKPGIIVRIEKKYACGDVFVDFQGPAPKDLQGLSEKEVRGKYSPDEGWSISKLSGGIVKLSQSVNDLCDRHRQYRHLGIYQGMLVVYEGPLGYNESLIRVERNIAVENLPPELRIKLQQAMDFERQASSTKLQLRKQLEFSSEQDLNTALDSLDELGGEHSGS